MCIQFVYVKLVNFSPSKVPVPAVNFFEHMWFISHRTRNKMNHIKFGNHQPPIKVATLNIGGFAEPSKWLATKMLDVDVLAICETHLQHIVQHSLYLQFPNHHLVNSPGCDDRHFTGVSFLIKKSICWAYKSLQWPSDHPCHKFAQDNRLLGVQIWLGDGNQCIFICNLYLPSGARWEAHKKKYAHDCLKAVQQDLCERGDVVALVLGDMNLTLEDSKVLQAWKAKGPLIDTNCTAPAGFRWNATCHQGKGSRIDFILAYKSAIDLVQNYKVTRTSCSTNHSMISIDLDIPKASQVRRTQRSVAELPELDPPKSTSDILPDTLPSSFRTQLRSSNTTEALQIWSQHAEKLLFQIANYQKHEVQPTNIHRGQIKFHDIRNFPKVIDGQATTLKDRQIWKAECRAVECQKAQAGYRRDKTWQKMSSIIPILPNEYQTEFRSLVEQPVSFDHAKRAETILQHVYQQHCKQNSSQRLLNWKKRMRSNENEAAKWLRTKNKKEHSRHFNDQKRTISQQPD